MVDINTGMKNFSSINRKLHIHLGLFILLFIWLFFISGLIMNHGKWKASKFYEKRVEEKTGYTVSASIIYGNPDVANTIKTHLNIAGEVSNIRIETGTIGFRISSPGLVHEVNVDTAGKGSIKIVKYNFWGKLLTLHLFNGMNKNDPEQRPNWMVTKLWRIMMDTTAIILIILSLGSWIMWYKVRQDYKAGYIFLAAGLIIAGYFLFFTELL